MEPTLNIFPPLSDLRGIDCHVCFDNNFLALSYIVLQDNGVIIGLDKQCFNF